MSAASALTRPVHLYLHYMANFISSLSSLNPNLHSSLYLAMQFFLNRHLSILYFFTDYTDDTTSVEGTPSSQLIYSNENRKYLSLYTLY